MSYLRNEAPVKGELPREWLAASCAFIVEVPGTVDFSPPYAVRYSGIGVVSKLGRSVLVGAERIGDGARVEFGDISYFIPEAKHYQPVAADRLARLERRLPEILHQWTDPLSLETGFRIHVVSELPFYRGLNLDAALAVGMAVMRRADHYPRV